MNDFLSRAEAWAGGVLEMIALGGPVVALLIAMSILALTIVLLKLWQFSAMRVGDRRTATSALKVYRAGSAGDAAAIAGKSRNPVAQVLARAIRGKHRVDLADELVREEVLRYGADQLETLRSHFRPLEVIASLAPLLGLFGTVLGMIEAFRDLEAAGSQVNPAILSGGIWQALLTTAAGLAVAMPVIVALNWLERVVDRLAHDMDNVVTQVFTMDLSRAPAVHGHELDPERVEVRPLGE
ncbi:MotA/TolQ/ExbB proton channel family protein [Salinisphaera sp. P385]|uniref:MotA/TolQ/ExbB proton channel family protein n=1 Tax=Spectribacter acetivorans TaxID=3075603 RepID=A0ABU3BBS7_9GAMM|nr:MotA/TolQ/ExbB proton channel family protein [Salinisphaera sp. P385]MDT0618718.1 MotA/TolQ/ExbB proton channel family protein [Salinisphaera sp. P385]